MAAKGKRKAEVELTLKDRMGATLKNAQRSLRSFAKSGTKKVGSGIAAGGKALLGGFGFKGADFLTDAFEGVVDLERSLTRFQIATNASDQATASFRTSLGETSAATGIGREKILAGAHAYVAFTGDAKGAAASMRLFAEVSNATGSPLEEIAAAAGAMRENLKLDPSQFRAGFDILTTQGKAGAVEIKDLATQISNVAPMFAKFAGGTGTNGLAEMGAIMQMMRKDFGGVEETATGFKSIMSQIARKSTDLKKMGVKIFDKKGNQRGFLAIVDDFAKLKRAGKLDQVKLIDVLGEQKAVNALNAVIDRRTELASMISSSVNSNAIAKDSAKYMASSAFKIDAAWNNVKLSIADALTPERINELANALTKAADAFVKVIGLLDTVLKPIDFKNLAQKTMDAEQADAKSQFRSSVNKRYGGLSNAQKMEKADALDKYRSTIKGEGLSTTDYVGNGHYWGAKEGADDLRRSADPWIDTTRDKRYAKTGSAVDSAMIGNFLNQGADAEGSARSMLAQLAQASRAGNANGTAGQVMTFVIKLGDDVAAKAVTNARVHRTKPGGSR